MTKKVLLIMPSYCKEFRCIADKCQRSCCRAGWEIDIDEVTLEKYRSEDGRLGEELRNSITVSEDGSECFQLDNDGVCPFLDEKGLCRLILEKGEGMLCDICREHPRFYNFLPGITEMGIGLCCEEACRLIIEGQTPIELICTETEEPDDEYAETAESDILLCEDLLLARKEIFDILADSSIRIAAKLSGIAELYDIPEDDKCRIPNAEPLEFAKTLEPFDDTYVPMLDRMISDFDKIESGKDEGFSCLLNRLAEYFVFRYYIRAYDREYSVGTYVKFALFCVEFIRLMLGSEKLSGLLTDSRDIIDAVCNFSNQIEYCEENVYALLSYFEGDEC